MEHYEHYYKAKTRCSKVDVLSMLSPSWISSLESAFLWIGGWRPSMAFHLLYSKSGLQLEAKFSDMLGGFSTDDLADLSPAQINRKMAKHQEAVADASMVDLSHAVSEMMRSISESGTRRADDLRLKTLQLVVDILTPIQAAHFLIAAAELHLRAHDWGKERDAREELARRFVLVNSDLFGLFALGKGKSSSVSECGKGSICCPAAVPSLMLEPGFCSLL
ncbi:hypothetical protein K2173_000955 [Erythroxylum novogranatense]|uniref:DOG1 domain-containing protein n=1 Tax=Erythroxylum novogranatense TaxID=1862640 RepID=A0AAV8TQG4_9ROSI|nr:hypothetical protein K2173_000955 [Erythroxylum novogranatense]